MGNDFIGGSDNRSIGAVLHANPELCETLLVNERVLGVADRVLLPERPMATSSKPVPREKPRLATSDAGCAQLLSVTSPPERGPYCHHYRVGASASLQARTRGAVQLLHREMAIYEPFVEHGPSSRDFILNMMWAGTDFTVANGATRVVPGSHRAGGTTRQRRQADGHIPLPGRQLARPRGKPVPGVPAGGRGPAVGAGAPASRLPVEPRQADGSRDATRTTS